MFFHSCRVDHILAIVGRSFTVNARVGQGSYFILKFVPLDNYSIFEIVSNCHSCFENLYFHEYVIFIVAAQALMTATQIKKGTDPATIMSLDSFRSLIKHEESFFLPFAIGSVIALFIASKLIVGNIVSIVEVNLTTKLVKYNFVQMT
ncbi:hypothetical protein ACJX0J_039614, partial [Zea mays]